MIQHLHNNPEFWIKQLQLKENNHNSTKSEQIQFLPSTQTHGVNVNINRIITPAKYDAKTA
jgi:hypothetical protein